MYLTVKNSRRDFITSSVNCCARNITSDPNCRHQVDFIEEILQTKE